MKLEKFVLQRMAKNIGKLVLICFLFLFPIIVGKIITTIMKLDLSGYVFVILIGYIVIFVVVSFFEHYKSAKKYMEEHNVSPEVAWYCTKPHSDEFEA